MDNVKAGEVVRQGIGLVKLKRVVFLRFNVYADNLKACSMVSHSCAAGATKKIK